jgi:hypothetical protein
MDKRCFMEKTLSRKLLMDVTKYFLKWLKILRGTFRNWKSTPSVFWGF